MSAAPGELILAVGIGLCGHVDLDGSQANHLESIVRLAGSGRAAARYLGVPESTLRGWRRGVTPRRPAGFFATALRTLASHRTGRWGPAYSGETELRIKGVVRVSDDIRSRVAYVGRWIPRQVMQGILRAWRDGDDQRAERLLYKAIDTHYQPLDFLSIVGAWFE